MSPVVVFIFALWASACNGTFGVLHKLESVRKVQVPSHIFTFWMGMGVCLSSLMLIPANPQAFTPLGLISGLGVVLSAVNCFLAIELLGLSLASALWFGAAVLSDFIFHTVFLMWPVLHGGRAFAGLVLVILGMAAVASSSKGTLWAAGKEVESTDFAAVRSDDHDEDSENAHMATGPNSSITHATSAPAAKTMDPDKASFWGFGKKTVSGLVCAVLAGTFGGLILAPMRWTGHPIRGVPFLPSMGAGVGLFAPVVTVVVHHRMHGRLPWFPELRQVTQAAALPGLIAGALWNLGTVLGVLALPGLGLGMTYPFMQCGLFVAGTWGVFMFKELTLKAQLLYWPSVVVIALGAALLVYTK